MTHNTATSFKGCCSTYFWKPSLLCSCWFSHYVPIKACLSTTLSQSFDDWFTFSLLHFSGVRIADSDPHYFISEDGSLEIFSADPADTATYSCTAINVAGVMEKRITLFVQSEILFNFEVHDSALTFFNSQLTKDNRTVMLNWEFGKIKTDPI